MVFPPCNVPLKAAWYRVTNLAAIFPKRPVKTFFHLSQYLSGVLEAITFLDTIVSKDTRSDKVDKYENCYKQNEVKVLIFWVEFWELSQLTRDLSQAESKINFVTS